MKKSILTTLSVLATACWIISPLCQAETSAQQRDQAVMNDNNTLNNLTDTPDNDSTIPAQNDDDQTNNDADNGDSGSNSDDGND